MKKVTLAIRLVFGLRSVRSGDLRRNYVRGQNWHGCWWRHDFTANMREAKSVCVYVCYVLGRDQWSHASAAAAAAPERARMRATHDDDDELYYYSVMWSRWWFVCAMCTRKTRARGCLCTRATTRSRCRCRCVVCSSRETPQLVFGAVGLARWSGKDDNGGQVGLMVRAYS